MRSRSPRLRSVAPAAPTAAARTWRLSLSLSRVGGPRWEQTSATDTQGQDVDLRFLRVPPRHAVRPRQQVRHGEPQEGRGEHLRERQPRRPDEALPENRRHEGRGESEEHLLLHAGPGRNGPGADGSQAAQEGQVPADRGDGPTAAPRALTLPPVSLFRLA